MTEAEVDKMLVKVFKPIFEALQKRLKNIEVRATELEARSVERVRALEAQVSALQRNKDLADSRLGLLEQMTK